MKQKNVNLILLQALFLCVSGIIVMKMFSIDRGSSLLFLLTFPLTGLLWLWNVRKGLQRTDLLMIILAALAAACVLIDLLINKGSLSFSYLRKLIMFIMTLLFLQSVNKIRPDWRLAEFLQVAVDILTVLMAFMFVAFHQRMYLINGIVSRYLTFGFGNPNALAMYLAPMFMLTFCTLMKRDGKPKVRLFRLAVLAAQGVFVLATQSRNALMMLMLFGVVALYVILQEKIEARTGRHIPLSYPSWLAWVIGLFPIIFAVLYMALIGTDWIGKIFGFMVTEGKELDSRVKEWSPAFEVIFKSPIIGSYFNISDGTGSSQMHSTHVDTAACYGIPVMLLMGFMQKIYIHQNGKVYRNKVNFLYMTAFCCSLLMGTFEAAVYSGGLGVYVFALIFLALSKTRRTKREPDVIYGWDWIGLQVSRIRKRLNAGSRK